MAQLTKAVRKTQRDAAFQFLGEPVTYREVSSTKDFGTGVVTPTNTDTVIGTDTDDDPGVVAGAVTESMINKSGGAILPDDIVFRVRQSDMPEEPPVITSKIIRSSDSVVYDIMSHTKSSDENVYLIVGRKV